ncbi:hypothetical protein IWQ61_000938 [Dispira simplex]|nr:hypothetical protein IWQ61_000938 [Dispira simplex]
MTAVLEVRIALHDFTADHEDEISFNSGERILVLERDEVYNDGWWQGQNARGDIGLFPVNFTEVQSADSPSQTSTPANRVSVMPGLKPYTDLINNLEVSFRNSEYMDDPTTAYLAADSIDSLQHSPDQRSRLSSGGSYLALSTTDLGALTEKLELPVGATVTSHSNGTGLVSPLSYQEEIETALPDNWADTPLTGRPDTWSIEQVAAWLHQRGFGTFVPLFVENEISGDVLLDLNLTTLKELQVTTFGKRYHLMNAITELKEKNNQIETDTAPSSRVLVSPTSQPSNPHTSDTVRTPPGLDTTHPSDSIYSLPARPAAPTPPTSSSLSPSVESLRLPQRSQSRPPSSLIVYPSTYQPFPEPADHLTTPEPRLLRHVNSFGVEVPSGSPRRSASSPVTGDEDLASVDTLGNRLADVRVASSVDPEAAESAEKCEPSNTVGASSSAQITRAASIRHINAALKRRNTATKVERERRQSPAEEMPFIADMAPSPVPPVASPVPIPNAEHLEQTVVSSASPAVNAVPNSFSSPGIPVYVQEEIPTLLTNPSLLTPQRASLFEEDYSPQSTSRPLFRNRSTQKPLAASALAAEGRRSAKSVDISRPLLEEASIQGNTPTVTQALHSPDRIESYPLAHTRWETTNTDVSQQRGEPNTHTGSTLNAPDRPLFEAVVPPRQPLVSQDTVTLGPLSVAPTPVMESDLTPNIGRSVTYHLERDDIKNPDHQGCLKKRAGGYPLWQSRWFVLKGPNLYYFKSPRDTMCRGIINLLGYRVIPDEHIKAGKYCFKCIHESKRTYYFHDENAQYIQDWIKVLLKATIGGHVPVTSSSNMATVPLHVAQSMRPRPPALDHMYAEMGDGTLVPSSIPGSERRASESITNSHYLSGGPLSSSPTVQSDRGMSDAQFIMWINHVLASGHSNMVVIDLFTELRDGLVLLLMLGILADQRIDTEQSPLLRVQNTLALLKDLGVPCELIPIIPQNIMEGDVDQTLTLLTLIRNRFPNSVPSTIFDTTVV